MNASKPKRRWTRFLIPRYSLRTLILVMTVIALLLGNHVHKVREQERVVAWVKKHGGRVTYKYEDDTTGSKYGWEPEFLRNLLGDDFFYDLHWVEIIGTEKGDLTPLASLTNLDNLLIDCRQVNDLSPLSSLTNLDALIISCRQVNDLSPLASLTDLRHLDLYDTSVRDFSLLVSLKNLNTLVLNNPEMTKEEVEELRKALPQCRISAFTFDSGYF